MELIGSYVILNCLILPLQMVVRLMMDGDFLHGSLQKM